MARRKKWWSFNAGQRDRDWVRAYCEGCPGRKSCVKQEEHTGPLYLEWYDTEADPETGKQRRVRRRARLRGVTTASEAIRRALDAAKQLDLLAKERAAPVTLARLLSIYSQEVTPTKGESKQGHDRRATRIWLAFFDAQPEEERRSHRQPSTLDRTDWDRFIAARRAGQIDGWGPVRDRQVGYDLKFMISVLNWATGAGQAGKPYLERNPWGSDIRRSQKWEMPKELSPKRPAMTNEIRSRLIEHAPGWQFGAALELERETRRRNNAIRQLLWSDIDLTAETVRWRGETDKAGRANVTPLSPRAVEILRGLPSRGVGAVPVFPAPTDATRPTSRHTFQTWLRRAKQRWLRTIDDPAERARLAEQLRGLGFHGEKRAGVRDPQFRRLEPKIQEELAGTNFDTLKNTYDEVSVEEMRKAFRTASGGN